MQRPNAGLRRVSAGPTPNAGYRAALDQQVSANVMQLQPGAADATARADLLARLQTLAEAVCTNYPGARLQAFGSSVSGLHSSGADLDLSLVLPGEVEIPDAAQRAMVSELAEKLEASGQYTSVVARPKARVPIVALHDAASGLKSDICMCNRLALLNSRLLRCYMELDPRAPALCFAVKHWAKQRGVNEPYRGSPSSYAWALMAIHFLQTRQPPVLPCLQTLRGGGWSRDPSATLARTPDGHEFDCSFCADVVGVRAAMAMMPRRNTESVGDLVVGFFRRYSREFDFYESVASVRSGLFLSKAEKNWKAKEKNVKDEEGKVTKRGDRHLFCVEDPFEATHDLGRVMDRDTLRDVRSEIDRAHVMLSERRCQWAAVCEQFVDPNPKTKGRGTNPDAKGGPASASASPALTPNAAPQTEPPPVALD
jgi:DNA polymerase sigma